MPVSRDAYDSAPPHSPSLSDFGHSTGLFDNSSVASASFHPRGQNQSAVPLNLGPKPVANNTSKMVNERSAPRPSAAAVPANSANESRPLEPRDKGPTMAPQFGRATVPNSPFRKQNNYESQNQEPKNHASNDGMFLPSKPAAPRQPMLQHDQQPRDPHLQQAKEFVKSHIPGHQPSGRAMAVPPTPIRKPSGPEYTTTKATPSAAYGTFGTKYESGAPKSLFGGFKPVNNNYQPNIQPAGQYKNPTDVDRGYKPIPQPVGQYQNPIDLTTNRYNYDRLAQANDPYSFVDPKKAAEDLKALLEGAIEDEDDVPKTRSRKKKPDGASALSGMMKSLAVTADASLEEEDEDEDDGTVEGIRIKLLPHQVEGLAWMTGRELGTTKKGVVPKGGILADDMGLGKTLQSVSLIVSNSRPSGSDLVDGKRKFPADMGKGTLVVAPLALIRQWEAEIKDKVTAVHALRVIVHHGPQRTKNYNDLKKYDVVITTYQILVSEHGNSSDKADGVQVGCFGIHWYRVILDEAHTIKNRNAKATQACYALRSEYRWCLTGTPMQNNLDELQSLIKFLRIKPYDDLKQWKDQIDRPMKNGRGDVAMKRLQHYLKIFMKRRTKEILKKEGALNPGGKALAAGEVSKTGFKVTERRIEKVLAEFSPQERLFYEKLETRTDKSLKNMMDGSNINYASALVLLLRLRQACNHPKLCSNQLGKDGEALGAEVATIPSTPNKNAVADEMDDLADMFGQTTVGTKNCGICQLPLHKDLARAGAARCEECEEDLMLSTKKPKTKKESARDRNAALRGARKQPHFVELDSSPIARSETPPQKPKVRKPRNRNVIPDSDDDEGSWVVSGDEKDPLRLGKAGGTTDEDADGTGEDINSSDEDSRNSQDGYEEDDNSILANTTRESVRTTRSVVTVDGSPMVRRAKGVTTISSDSEQSDNESIVEVEESDSDSELPANPTARREKSDQHKMSEVITSTKITHLLRILGKEADEHKFIVFSQFTSMLDLIEPFLQRDGYKYTRYDGSMRNDLREAALKMLREEKSCRILLCSLKCGSLGLNLTAATRVVILEPFWNPFVEEQAIDRVHRLTQKTDVIVYKITIKDSVEERILELQEKKRELANQAIEGGKGGAGKLGMQEIMQLFRRDAESLPPTLGDATSYTKGGAMGGVPAPRGEERYVREGSRESTGSTGFEGGRAKPVKKWRSGKTHDEHPVYGRR